MTFVATVAGRLVSQPEQRTGPSGKVYALARMTVAIEGDERLLVSLIAFGTAAAQLAALRKDDACCVQGRGKVTSWAAKEDGSPRAGLNVTVDAVLNPHQVRQRRKAAQEAQEGAATPVQPRSAPGRADALDDGQPLDF